MDKTLKMLDIDVATLLNAYKEANGCSRAEMAREIGLPQRRLRGFMKENRKPDDFEEFVIREWLEKEGFDYIPPKMVISKDSVASKPKPAKKVSKDNKPSGMRSDAKALVLIYKEWSGLKSDTDATTELIKRGFMTLLKEDVLK